jgi:hypothetical protein
VGGRVIIAMFVSSMAFFPLAVSHAEETTDDVSVDQFLLECVWTADRHHNTHACGGFPTRALCEREGRAAVASGELLSFNCVLSAEKTTDDVSADGSETTDDNDIGKAIAKAIIDAIMSVIPVDAFGSLAAAAATKPADINEPSAPDQMAQLKPADAAPALMFLDGPGFEWMRAKAPPWPPGPPNVLPPGWAGTLTGEQFRPVGQGWDNFMRNAKVQRSTTVLATGSSATTRERVAS